MALNERFQERDFLGIGDEEWEVMRLAWRIHLSLTLFELKERCKSSLEFEFTVSHCDSPLPAQFHCDSTPFTFEAIL